MKEFSKKIIDDKIPVRNSTWVFRAGDQSFTGIGIPRLGCNTNIPEDSPLKGKTTGGGAGGWWWHTPHATMEYGDVEVMAMDVRVELHYIFKMLNSPVIPFNFTTYAEHMLKILKEYQVKAGKIRDYFNLDPLIEKAEKLVDFLLSEECEIMLANSKSRQIPLGPVDESKIPSEVSKLKEWAKDGTPLDEKLLPLRSQIIEWLKGLGM